MEDLAGKLEQVALKLGNIKDLLSIISLGILDKEYDPILKAALTFLDSQRDSINEVVNSLDKKVHYPCKYVMTGK